MIERRIINILDKIEPDFVHLPFYIGNALDDFLALQSNSAQHMFDIADEYKELMSKAEEQTIDEFCTIYKVPAKDYKKFEEYFESSESFSDNWKMLVLKEYALAYGENMNYPVSDHNNLNAE